MRILYNNFIKSFEFLSNWKYLILTVLSDFLFIISIIASWGFISSKLLQNYDLLQEMAGSISAESIETGGEAALGILAGQLDVVKSAVSGIYLNLFMFILLIFISYAIFGGFSWLMVKLIVNKEKLKLRLRYFLRFGGLSLIWTLLLLLLFYLILQGMTEDVNVMVGIELFVIVYSVLLVYFAMISYAYFLKKEKILNVLKNTFVNGIKKIYIFVPLFVIIGLVFFLISSFIGIFASFSFLFLIPIIIFLVLCIWARIYLVLVVKNL